MERMKGVPISQTPALKTQGTDPESSVPRRRGDLLHPGLPRRLLPRRHAPKATSSVATDGPTGATSRIDFGIIGTPQRGGQELPRDQLPRLLPARLPARGAGPHRGRLGAGEDAGGRVRGGDPHRVRTDLRQALKDISFGKTLLRLFQTARRFEMEVQPQLVLLQKTLLNIEGGLGRQLDPSSICGRPPPFLERWMDERMGVRALVRGSGKRRRLGRDAAAVAAPGASGAHRIGPSPERPAAATPRRARRRPAHPGPPAAHSSAPSPSACSAWSSTACSVEARRSAADVAPMQIKRERSSPWRPSRPRGGVSVGTRALFHSPRADANTKGPTMLLWLVVAYLVVSIGIGLYAATRVHNARDYITAGRNLPMIVVLAMVFATWFGAETVLASRHLHRGRLQRADLRPARRLGLPGAVRPRLRPAAVPHEPAHAGRLLPHALQPHDRARAVDLHRAVPTWAGWRRRSPRSGWCSTCSPGDAVTMNQGMLIGAGVVLVHTLSAACGR